MLHVLFTSVSDPVLRLLVADRAVKSPRSTIVTGNVCIYLSPTKPINYNMSWDMYHEINADWKDTWLLHMVYVHQMS